MAGDKKLTVTILGDAKSLAGAVADANSHMGKLATGVGDFAKKAAVGLAAGAAGFGAFVGGGVKSLIEVEKLSAQTSAVLKSTGGAAGVTRDHIEDYADALEKKTGIEAESIQSGQNLLLTFTNVRNGVGAGNDVFDQATSILTDMSVALGTDVSTSAVQLGKALNDPIAGVSALTKVGVTFDDQQKQQIKTLVESGKTMDAQKIILAELNKEFGGSAAAFGDTTAGKVAKLKNSFGDLQEKVAAKLMPVLLMLTTWAQTKGLPYLERLGEFLSAKLGPVFDAVRRGVSSFLDAFRNFNALGEWEAHGQMEKLGVLAAKVFGWLRDNVPRILATVRDVVAKVFGWIRDNVPPILAAVADFVRTKVIPAVQQLAGWVEKNLVPAIEKLWASFAKNILPVLRDVAQFIAAEVLPRLAEIGKWIAEKVLPIIGKLVTFIIGDLIPAFFKVVGFITKELLPKIAEIGKWFKEHIIDPGADVVAWFRDLPDKIGGFFRSIGETIIAPFRTAFAAIAALWNNTVGKIRFTTPDWLPGIGGKSWGFPTIDVGGVGMAPSVSNNGSSTAIEGALGRSSFTAGGTSSFTAAPPATMNATFVLGDAVVGQAIIPLIEQSAARRGGLRVNVVRPG